MTGLKTLELATDILVMGEQSELTNYPDRFVQRTPEQPDFWFGNRTIFKSLPKDAEEVEAQISIALRDHPGVDFSVIFWDVPDVDTKPFTEPFEAAGYEIETGITLAGDLAVRPGLPGGISFREITSDAAWEAVIELQLAGMLGDGYDPDTAESYIHKSFARRRSVSESGRGGWFGLYDDDLLVADMGLVWSPELVRYQSVETRESHRRRGLCAALLGEVSAYASERHPGARQVIVAEDGTTAARLYQRAGFVPVERVVSASRTPK
ncbi:GNAT family N-acetyltransferase [Celeribacter persicus]|uniref:Acetyltransferase (GNAT) family protein n=1 Tax=Celeribacter persicus TaxID=1651082 RepID=A0A2T5HDV6_9RHOB|nr:GNAT family N-acetyltransferase [Celeribacter persicus]PTQ69727.1 acetyltransferase (GNAT) family protein [Celeribacter persicus]